MIPSLSTMMVACLAVNLTVNAPGSPAVPVINTTLSATYSDLFDLNFNGGTLQEYVDAIRKKVRNANIIVMPEAMNIIMPPIELTSVELRGALAMLDNLSRETGSQEIVTSLSFHMGNQDLGELDIYTINASSYHYKFSTLVFSVSDILQGDVSDQALLSTIESSLELVSENHPEAKVQFHPETGIIIVRGYDSQVELVNNLLDELNQAAARKQQLTEQSAFLRSQQEQSLLKQQFQMEMNESMTRQGLLEREIARLQGELIRCESVNIDLEQEVSALKKDKGME